MLSLILVAAGLLDVYRLQEARDWAYRAAEAAAVSGAAQGRDFSTVYHDGQVRIDPVLGQAAAEQTLQLELAQRGLSGATYQIEVSEWGGDAFAGYPPLARADLWNSSDWTPAEPAVGVYVDVPVPTFLLGLVQLHGVHVHAFAVAGLGEGSE